MARMTMVSKYEDKCGRCGVDINVGETITFGRPAGAMHPAAACRASEFYAGSEKALVPLTEEARKVLRREQKAARTPVVVTTTKKATRAKKVDVDALLGGLTAAQKKALLEALT